MVTGRYILQTWKLLCERFISTFDLPYLALFDSLTVDIFPIAMRFELGKNWFLDAQLTIFAKQVSMTKVVIFAAIIK